MQNRPNSIGWLNITGAPFDIGFAAGESGREAVHRHLLPSTIWGMIKDKQHTGTVNRLSTNTQQRFPHIWEELRGLAEGLKLPWQDVIAWNCRGEILASTPDGCSTVIQPGTHITIAHNEDGLPFFRGHCFILNAAPDNQTAFSTFCYPGSLAGHTFGWNNAGIAQAVNNLRLNDVTPDIPRMVLGRAVIGSPSLDDAIGVLSDNPNSAGFHMTLAETKSMRLLSVEYGAGKISVLPVTTRRAHTNHTLHLSHPSQTITTSSKDRQIKLEQLISKGELDDLDILRDTSGPGLPIRRDDPADPDEENTLATCTINVSPEGITWRLHDEYPNQS